MFSTPPYSVGIDPDSHNCAFAVTCPSGIVAAKVVKVGKEFKGQAAVEAMIQHIIASIPTWIHHLVDSHRMTAWPSYVIGEGQQIYAKGKTKNPGSVLMLAPIVGAAIAAVAHSNMPAVRVPLPNQWKGDIPKSVCQARVLRKRGISYAIRGSRTAKRDTRYAVPLSTIEVDHIYTEGRKMLDGDWKHLVDAIGLADWGLGQYNHFTAQN